LEVVTNGHKENIEKVQSTHLAKLELGINSTIVSTNEVINSVIAPIKNDTLEMKEKYLKLEQMVNETMGICKALESSKTKPAALPEPLVHVHGSNETKAELVDEKPKCHQVFNATNESGYFEFSYSEAQFCIWTFNIGKGKGLKVEMVDSTIPTSRCGKDHLTLFEFYRNAGTIWRSNGVKLCSKGSSVVLENALSVIGVFHSDEIEDSDEEYSFKIKYKVISSGIIVPKLRKSGIIWMNETTSSVAHHYPENQSKNYENDLFATTVIGREDGVSYKGAKNLRWTYTGVDIEYSNSCKFDFVAPFGIEAVKRGAIVDVNVVLVGSSLCGTWGNGNVLPNPFSAKDGIILIISSDENNSKGGYAGIASII
jgi:hypothetical protein